MSSLLPPWQRLAAAARQAPEERDSTLPYGFSTRVAALAMASPASSTLKLRRLSLRALGVGSLLMLVTIAANAGPILTALQDEAEALGDTTVGVESLELS